MAHDNERDLDAPTPPGGPLRQDAPSADVNPGPQEHPVGTDPDQAENAATSLDEPSDNSGAE